jgi:hypothetical protein
MDGDVAADDGLAVIVFLLLSLRLLLGALQRLGPDAALQGTLTLWPARDYSVN